MNVPETFVDLVYSADNHQEYIGMGNPNAQILIIGREPAHDTGTEEGKNGYYQDQQLNKTNWKNLIENKPIKGRCNPRRPFPNQKCLRAGNGNDGTSNTWVWYQKLVDLILGRDYECPYRLRPLDFHDFCFHTDISAVAAKNASTTDSQKKMESVKERSKDLFSHHFFKQFPIVILAIGTDVGEGRPVSLTWCETILGFPIIEVEKAYNEEAKEPMIWINRDSKTSRILIHTYSLSQTTWKYITKIRDIIRSERTSDFCWPKKY